MNLKDEYNKTFVEDLATKLSTETSFFDKKSFLTSIINKNWEAKELKERMRHITETIHSHLDFDYQKQIKILSNIAPNFKGLTAFIFPDFIQVYGLDYTNTSLKALELFTQYSTAEFAIRPFIEKYPEATMQQLLDWSKHKNEHLRRLSSEGCRPRLPWASPLREFIANPNPVLPILENLKNDESLYVRKSVANHINDISKDHPNLVLELTKKWYGKTKNTDWIVKHALRTLLKKGDKKALAIFGLDNSKNLETSNLKLSKNNITIGDFIHFEFDVSNNSNQTRNIRLEYKVAFVKANKSTSNKVFQLSEFSLKANAKKHFKRKQWFKELSTRKHYPGKHQITLIINGDKKNKIGLELSN
ncbi:MAG: DNA alkylation repair protein [Flavobacteriales bacterium]|nr:DNA alkylation repair protein [Flavobacteriales bacterium]